MAAPSHRPGSPGGRAPARRTQTSHGRREPVRQRSIVQLTAALAVVTALAGGMTPAASQTREAAAGQVARIIQESAAGVQGEIALARSLRTPATEEALRRKAAEQAEFSVNTYVVGAIAERPASAGEVVAGAVGAAPSLRDSIVRSATQAFPFMAGAIAAGASAPSAPVLRPPTAIVSPAAPVRTESMAAAGPPPPAPDGDNDPLEGFNRAVFAFNDVFDRFLLRPLAYGYGAVTPDRVKEAVRSFFLNLGAPVVLANDLLQVDGGGAATTGGRFMINSTVGLLGFFDVAKAVGLPAHPADFGQTLYRYGAGSGPYLMLPFFGPSSIRDGAGTVVDTFLNPLTYVLDFYPRLAVTSTDAVTRQETLIAPLDDLRANSVDYYAALRSAYFQDRAVALRKGMPTPARQSGADKAFEDFE
ncbi:MAG: VacJ family lipoprotein [Alphaproteobacteria bacterium]|nr:VacJ family lipoprotein [Alphaproteobacteria bacterium]